MDQLFNLKPVIFGEVLFDIFPEGTTFLGGAPFNVAWNLKMLGADPLFVTSVGADKLGEFVLKTMEKVGLSTEAVQIDKMHPTGKVSVCLSTGEPRYNIECNQAYDFISFPDVKIPEKTILYHGSLAMRNENSRSTLDNLKVYCGELFVDINIRKPWFNYDQIRSYLHNLNWLKVNEEELSVLLKLKKINLELITNDVKSFMKDNSIENMIITLGDKGSWIFGREIIIFQDAHNAEDIVDTVGAGDMFSAAMLYGIINNFSYATIFERASLLSAEVCRHKGALISELKFQFT